MDIDEASDADAGERLRGTCFRSRQMVSTSGEMWLIALLLTSEALRRPRHACKILAQCQVGFVHVERRDLELIYVREIPPPSSAEYREGKRNGRLK